MARLLLTDEDWALIADVFPPPAATGRPRCDPRRVLDGIFWVLRTGSPWRDLPANSGPYTTCYHRFLRRASGTRS